MFVLQLFLNKQIKKTVDQIFCFAQIFQKLKLRSDNLDRSSINAFNTIRF